MHRCEPAEVTRTMQCEPNIAIVLHVCEIFDLSTDCVTNELAFNKHNRHTATYYLLFDKHNRTGFLTPLSENLINEDVLRKEEADTPVSM